VFQQLEGEPFFQYKYLHSLYMKDHPLAPRFHELLLQLYAEYDRPHLLPFLRRSTNYNLHDAKELCARKEFYPELIYILGVTGGQSEAALQLIIQKEKNVKMVSFRRNSLKLAFLDFRLMDFLLNRQLSLYKSRTMINCGIV
jgi:vacuolar protein sorting-associated protein 41